MVAGNLTTLANVKAYLNLTVDTSDPLLNRMIKAASAYILNKMNRPTLALTEFTEVYDGSGNTFMVLRQNPVYSIEALSVGGSAVPAATGNNFTQRYTNGYSLEPGYNMDAIGLQRVNLYGWTFPNARGSIAVRYKAGFVRTDAYAIPATPGPYTITTDFVWLGDVGVQFADGTPLVAVAYTPAAGEYSVSDGVYTFNSTDADKLVNIIYSFVPADLSEATTMMVGERYKYMDRIGVLSKTLGGQETISYTQKAMPDYVLSAITPYMNVAPI